MLSVDAAERTAERLAGTGLPLVVYPNLYDIGGTKPFSWYVNNKKTTGWIAIPAPRPVSGQSYPTVWTVLVDACGPNEPVARAVAYKVQSALMHLSRKPTGYTFLGDQFYTDNNGGCKYTLTFMATLSQTGE